MEECRFFVKMDSKKREWNSLFLLTQIFLNIRNFFESDSVRLIYISIVYCSLYRYTITQVIKGDYNVYFIHEKYFKILRFGRQT